MRYSQRHIKNYIDKVKRMKAVPEDERVYFITDYKDRHIATWFGAWWDPVKKARWSAVSEPRFDILLNIYDISPLTSEKAKKLVDDFIKETSRKENDDRDTIGD